MSSNTYPPHGVPFLVPAAASVFSLWIWHRFDVWYAFPATMLFARFLPAYWTSSHSGQLVLISVLYAAGLIGIAETRSRRRSDCLDQAYSLAEAFLWLGLYLALNLKISAVDLPTHGWGAARTATEFVRPFYWTTWVLIWCLPPVILARGIRRKDRCVIAVGAITTLFTFISNKPYLEWQRHTWDTMLLGILLTGAALFLRRWLTDGPGGVRDGFTAGRLSRKDRHALSTASAALGLLSPHSITPARQTTSPDFHLGGGASGGGGAKPRFLSLAQISPSLLLPILQHARAHALLPLARNRPSCPACSLDQSITRQKQPDPSSTRSLATLSTTPLRSL